MNFYFWLVLLLQFVYAHACPSIQRCPFFESDHSALPKNAPFLLKHAIKKVKNESHIINVTRTADDLSVKSCTPMAKQGLRIWTAEVANVFIQSVFFLFSAISLGSAIIEYAHLFHFRTTRQVIINAWFTRRDYFRVSDTLLLMYIR